MHPSTSCVCGFSVHRSSVGFEIVALIIVCGVYVGMRAWEVGWLPIASRRWMRAWHDALLRRRMTPADGEMHGQIAGLPARARLELGSAGAAVTITVDLAHDSSTASLQLQLTSAPVGSAARSDDAVLLADPDFDARWEVFGPLDADASLLLNDHGRAVLVGHTPAFDQIVVRGSVLTATMFEQLRDGVRKPDQLCADLAALLFHWQSNWTSSPEQRVSALLATALLDRSAAVRDAAEAALRQLLKLAANDTAATLALLDPATPRQVRTAHWLSNQDSASVLQQTALRAGTPLPIRLQALQLLHARHQVPWTSLWQATFRHAGRHLPQQTPQLADLVAEDRQRWLTATVDQLPLVLAHWNEPQLLAWFDLLLNDPMAAPEPVLLRLLERQPPPTLRNMALEALQRVATPGSLPALNRLIMAMPAASAEQRLAIRLRSQLMADPGFDRSRHAG